MYTYKQLLTQLNGYPLRKELYWVHCTSKFHHTEMGWLMWKKVFLVGNVLKRLRTFWGACGVPCHPRPPHPLPPTSSCFSRLLLGYPAMLEEPSNKVLVGRCYLLPRDHSFSNLVLPQIPKMCNTYLLVQGKRNFYDTANSQELSEK